MDSNSKRDAMGPTRPEDQLQPQSKAMDASMSLRSGERSLGPDQTSTTKSVAKPSPVNQLTPEEQMALYEQDLKETDWGHQPC